MSGQGVDPHTVAVLTRRNVDEPFRDRTHETVGWSRNTTGVEIEFSSRTGATRYAYRGTDKAIVMEHPFPVSIPSGSVVEVDGDVWDTVTGLLGFAGPDGPWTRVFYDTRSGPSFRTYPGARVRLVPDAGRAPRAAAVLRYWRQIVERLPVTDGRRHPLAIGWDSLGRIDPESALATYLTGDEVSAASDGRRAIFPFSSNLSQRAALTTALEFPVSVIDGPPGTGKTQTILNLVASLVAADPSVSIGVVSSNNAAVDNVGQKLDALGYGFVTAALGNAQRRDAFFAQQPARGAAVSRFLEAARGDDPDEAARAADRLDELDSEIAILQESERLLAKTRQDLDAHRLEQRHFLQYLAGHEATDLDGMPLLRKSSDRIIDFIAETSGVPHPEPWPLRWLTRLRQRVRYGSLAGVDPSDSGTVLALQRRYYEQRIAELEAESLELEHRLERADLTGLTEEQQRLSVVVLRRALVARYADRPRRSHEERGYRTDFSRFTADHPVILSTCHSLRRSIAPGALLDVLIVDEASQVDLLAGALALAAARRVVVVGDLAQLSHIPEASAAAAVGPAPIDAYDYGTHSLLSSLVALHGDRLPRTMLREHYRCDPAIIGFCNEKFYDGQLIPFTTGRSARPVVVHTTALGNHMRQHRSGGRSNQREIDVIEREVIPQHCADVARNEIGVTSPYRRQVEKIGDVLVQELVEIEADTVHRFQGREKQVVVMSTVLDETWRGRTGTAFVDDPRLVNVAVSRAVEQFILVTDHEMLPTSRHLRDLVEYMRYHDPGNEPLRSGVVSVFDLLYRRFSERLLALSGRLRGELRFLSEDIIWTVLREVLDEAPYTDLVVVPQVLVQNVLPDTDRLTVAQATYVRNRCSLDFVVYRRIGRIPVLAVEVNGFAFHEDKPDQARKDLLKQQILEEYGLPLLSLATTESDEPARIRRALDAATGAAVPIR